MELSQRTMLMVVFLIMGSALVQSQSSDEMCTEQQEIVAVVDGSDSIYEKDFGTLKTALIGLTGNLRLNLGGQRFGVVLYSTIVSDTVPLNNNSQILSSKISKLTQPMQGTSTHLGILKMKEMMEDTGRPGVPRVGIVITDGRSFNRTATKEAAAQSRRSGIIMFAVGVGPAVNSTELRNIASSEDRVFKLNDFDELLANISLLVRKVCIVNGNWSEWTTTNEGPCSLTCGGGERTITQSRTCDNPPPSNGGKFCEGVNTQSYTESCNVVACPVSANPCDGCKWANGIGYNPDIADCSKYIQCWNSGLQYFTMSCALGTHWNQSELTCTAGNCDNSPIVTGGEDGSYTDGPCTLLAVDGNNKIYLQQVPGQMPQQMQCSSGTVFDPVACACVHGSNPFVPSVCKAELYLNFDSNFQDHSGNGISIQNENVACSEGKYASFFSNSVIRILRFSNMDFRDTLIISFLFKAGQTTSRNQSIVSNADCGEDGSIYIIQTSADIVFRVRNTANDVISLSVAYSATLTHRSYRATPQVPVSLVVHQGSMVASVGSQTKSVPFSGNIAKSHCAMQIGRGTGFDNFIGDLDDFRVFLCMPEHNGYLA